jgi:uncharacterized membrane protein
MRAWLKTGTYGTMHLLVAMAVAFAISGSWRVALGIGIVEPAVQTLFYTLHERLWGRLGRRPTSQTTPSVARASTAHAGLSFAPCPTCS